MCEECGCEGQVEINKSVTDVNDAIAHEISHNLLHKKIMCVNIMGAPGSGKTTVIEGMSETLGTDKLFVIQGDLESDIDKERLQKKGIKTYQINTHSGCHLSAQMINRALMDINLDKVQYLLIENVGNLVCPANVKIGQHMNIVVSSTTEGSDKPKKYPIIFMDSKLVVISKYDLKDAVDFEEKSYTKDLMNINGKLKIIKTSSKSNIGFDVLANYLSHNRNHLIEKPHIHK